MSSTFPSRIQGAPPVAPAWDRHHELFGRRSVLGGVVVLAVLTFFGLGLQWIADAVRSADGFSAGQAEQITELASFTPSPGWVNDAAQTVPGIGVVATKNGWQIKVAGGIELQPAQTLGDFAKVFHDIPPQEAGSQVTDLTAFTTASGLHGVSWEVHGPTTASLTWMIVNGTHVVQVLAGGPSATLDAVQDDLLAMASSVVIADGAGS